MAKRSTFNRVTFAEFYVLVGGSYQLARSKKNRHLHLNWRVRTDVHHALAKSHALDHGLDGYRLCRGQLDAPFYMTAAVMPVTHTDPLAALVAPETPDTERQRLYEEWLALQPIEP